jgi:hypothetical protein
MSFVVVKGGPGADGPVMEAFKAIAQGTGGEIIRIDADEALSEAFLRAVENFRTSYVRRYAPTGGPALGWHDVTVSVKSKRYTIRARRGYFAR